MSDENRAPWEKVRNRVAVGALVIAAGFAVEGGLTIQTDPERWIDQDGRAVTDLERLREGTGYSTELSILAHPGDRYVLGAGDTLAFTPVLWVGAGTPAGVYTATFTRVDVRTVGWPFGESGEFTIATAVPAYEARR